jgi:flagellar biosynthetic protein FliO
MENISYIGSLVKMLLALAVVLAMMVGAVYMLRNILGRTGRGMDDNEVIKILAVKSLGPRSSIMVIETLGKVAVIGVAGGQMNLLTSIDDPEALGRLNDIRRKILPNRSGLSMDDLRGKILKTFRRK